ncbi:MAG: SRPBCC family protein [Bacteroidota bacterium]
MKRILISGFSFLILLSSTSLLAQDKKTQSFTIERVIKAPAEKVWAVVGEDFGAIANSHPGIVSSSYLQGSLQGGEGVERVCNLNEAGTRYTHEKQVDYDPENYTFRAQVFYAEGVPVVPEYSYMRYKVERIDDQFSRLIMSMTYRTKPALMGTLAKGKFQKTIADYALAVDHHVRTGEVVNQDNFETIKAQYQD